MAAIDFQLLFEQLKKELADTMKTCAGEYVKEAKSDAQQFLTDSRQQLMRWTQLLVAGELTGKDYEFLLMGQKELMEMNALKNKGLALIRIDELKNKIISSILNTVSGFLK